MVDVWRRSNSSFSIIKKQIIKMSAIQKISRRAKAIRRAHPAKAWMACIKEASREYRSGKIGKVSTRQTGSSNKKRDKARRAKPPGKRVVRHSGGKSTVYYERRKNH